MISIPLPLLWLSVWNAVNDFEIIRILWFLMSGIQALKSAGQKLGSVWNLLLQKGKAEKSDRITSYANELSSRFSLCYSTGHVDVALSNMRTKASSGYTVLGLVYMCSSRCWEINYICTGCPTFLSMCRRIWRGSLGPSSGHWMKATSHPSEIFRGLHCVTAATLPPCLHWTFRCIVNSNNTLHCVVNSASLSTREPLSSSRAWTREGWGGELTAL